MRAHAIIRFGGRDAETKCAAPQTKRQRDVQLVSLTGEHPMGARSERTTKSHTVPARRRWLTRMTALASSAALPLWTPDTWAKSESTAAGLPRVALVIGNSDYGQAPLRN